MKRPLIRKRSTDGRDAVLGFALVVAVNALIIVDPWHYIKARWPALQVLETAFVVVIVLLALCMFGAVFHAIYVGFWPTLYSLVAWHRRRAEKRDAPAPRNSYVPATFSSNLTNDLLRIARLLLLGALGLGILWGIYAFSKWVTH
jgi:hypothetical protein